MDREAGSYCNWNDGLHSTVESTGGVVETAFNAAVFFPTASMLV